MGEFFKAYWKMADVACSRTAASAADVPVAGVECNKKKKAQNTLCISLLECIIFMMRTIIFYESAKFHSAWLNRLATVSSGHHNPSFVLIPTLMTLANCSRDTTAN